MQLQVAVNAPSEDVQWTRIRPHNHAISLKRPGLFERKTAGRADEAHEHKQSKAKQSNAKQSKSEATAKQSRAKQSKAKQKHRIDLK